MDDIPSKKLLQLIETYERAPGAEEQIRAIISILPYLESDSNPARAKAENFISSIAQKHLGDTRKAAGPSVIIALSDPDSNMGIDALVALGTHSIPWLINALGTEDKIIQRMARDTLVSIGAPAVPPLMRTLSHDGMFSRWRAANALIAIGVPAVPSIVEGLRDKEEDVRRLSTDMLIEIAKKSSLDMVAIQKSLVEFVETQRKTSDPQTIEEAEKEAGGYYVEIAVAARDSKSRINIVADGEGLEGKIRPPKSTRLSGDMFRTNPIDRPRLTRLGKEVA